MIEISDQIKKASALNLIQIGNALKKVSFKLLYNETVNSKQFNSPEKLGKLVAQVPLSDYPVIYKISCPNTKELTKLLEIYRAFHAINKKRTLRVNRINMARLNGTSSTTLYVGSTRCQKNADFRSRIIQHLGGGNFRTYAMQLSKWHKDLVYKINIQAINIIAKQQDCVTPQLLELVEQTYWDEYKPVFGKKAGL